MATTHYSSPDVSYRKTDRVKSVAYTDQLCKAILFARGKCYNYPLDGLANSQGDTAMISDKARRAWNLTGKGIRIGVMSDSYNTRFGNPAQ